VFAAHLRSAHHVLHHVPSRLNEAGAVVFLYVGLFVLISLASYHPFDPSWNTVTQLVKPANLTGRLGALVSDWLRSATIRW